MEDELQSEAHTIPRPESSIELRRLVTSDIAESGPRVEPAPADAMSVVENCAQELSAAASSTPAPGAPVAASSAPAAVPSVSMPASTPSTEITLAPAMFTAATSATDAVMPTSALAKLYPSSLFAPIQLSSLPLSAPAPAPASSSTGTPSAPPETAEFPSEDDDPDDSSTESTTEFDVRLAWLVLVPAFLVGLVLLLLGAFFSSWPGWVRAAFAGSALVPITSSCALLVIVLGRWRRWSTVKGAVVFLVLQVFLITPIVFTAAYVGVVGTKNNAVK